MRGIYICINCFETRTSKVANQIICSSCGHIEKVDSYRNLLNEIKLIVRYSYQYRLKYEEDFKTDPALKSRYYLHELGKIFEFLGLAVISGVAGNYAYDKIKEVINNIVQNPLLIKIQDKEFQRLLQDEAEMDTFIRYIEEYRNKRFSADKKILRIIFDEQTTHEQVERFLSSPKAKEIFKKISKSKSPKTKRAKSK